MARQKTLKSVKHYLDKTREKPRQNGASAVLEMVKRFKERQDRRP